MVQNRVRYRHVPDILSVVDALISESQGLPDLGGGVTQSGSFN